ncbi:regulator of chromosome condensation domain-containing protein [Tieghemostelium lacteum]|uniref:Regulator of chromosome condensation domain-containing protein n=1 Tax=Tieghemostelium lacteum TaxID=361077 RepID=A0A151ZEP4_TIELA|nr:regulator of chromosome condensation domain-containing protein [Tieghemostelium lacteum]|eukprot:KYQ92423.1 regulator of chromosome condensation domain-containing protein [Tieghemostelium lacteum]
MAGRLFMFGKNSHGQLGVEIQGKDIIYDQENFTSVPLLLETFSEVTCVACGPSYSGFINKGRLYMMGDGSFGKLGNGTTEDKRVPTPVLHEEYERFVVLVAGNEHSMALGANGFVYSWGSTTMGRLGHGDNMLLKVRTTPKIINGLKPYKIAQIAACGACSAAVTECGKLITWGLNKNGQLGHGNLIDQPLPKVVEFFNGLFPVVKVSIGNRQMGCIDSKGSLFMWGINESYQLGDGTSFQKNSPTPIKVKNVEFRDIILGGDFGTAISTAADNNSLYVWGGFVREYASSKPKKIAENVQSVACSVDCGKHLTFRKFDGSTHSIGWSRYGQTTYEMDTLVAENSLMETIIGTPSQISCGAYHTALLFTDLPSYVYQLIKLGHLNRAIHEFPNYLKLHSTFVNYNLDTILHVICKARLEYRDEFKKFFNLLSSPNKDSLYPHFYHAEVAVWDGKLNPDIINYQIPQTLDTCLHYYVKNKMESDIQLAMSALKIDTKTRNKAGKRALELMPIEEAYQLKCRNNCYDIGIVTAPCNEFIVNSIIQSLHTNHINSCMITSSYNMNNNCIGYIFCISKSTLTELFYRDLLLNFVSKQPMVSIWGEKTPIEDPVMESCIYRSQLVDFSQQSVYEKSISVLLQGVHNMISFIPKVEGEDEGQGDIKADADYITSRSDQESIFVSFDPSKAKQFKPLFDYFQEKQIDIIPREKGVLQSWLVIVILERPDLSPLMRDEISLAENRNKLVIPIYYGSFIQLDKGLTYSFANSPRILFTPQGFDQLLLSIKLQFKLLNQTFKLLSLKK